MKHKLLKFPVATDPLTESSKKHCSEKQSADKCVERVAQKKINPEKTLDMLLFILLKFSLILLFLFKEVPLDFLFFWVNFFLASKPPFI